MKIHAYVLAGDPAWLRTSLLSYYAVVDKIVVAYDRQNLGWTGVPIPVEECVEICRSMDPEGKMEFLAGHYAKCDPQPLQCETIQRRQALEIAQEGADWVLQFDTDEVMADPACFLSCLKEADAGGYDSLDFPSRYLFCALPNHRYLERAGRLWTPRASYPGSLAIKSGTPLRLARQTKSSLFRVDFRARNTDPFRGAHVPVHRVISPDQGVLHFSWVRSHDYLKRKFASWGHANDRPDGWNSEYLKWMWAEKHPALALLKTPFSPRQERFRRVYLPPLPHVKAVWGE
ncbi:MAG TPA: hypothetical protein VGB45_14740 [Abditibacterium sp.]|jgi:hypothetical protein